MPRSKRQLVADLFALDAALGDVVRTTTEPMVGRIRLAWWRERLVELDQGVVPAEPRLEAAARLVADTSLTGAMLAELVQRWEPMLGDFPWKSEVVGPVAGRGALCSAMRHWRSGPTCRARKWPKAPEFCGR